MKLNIEKYPGSSGGSGVNQWIINHIPECSYFVEGFAGSARIANIIAKETGVRVKVNEKYMPVFEQLKRKLPQKVVIRNIDTIEYYIDLVTFLEHYVWNDTLFYFDPPYLFSTRKSKRNIYGCEWTDEDHKRFLYLVKLLHEAGAMILIKHPDCILYDWELTGWHTSTMETMSRAGKMTEKIWMNYDIAQYDLLCTKYVGSDYIDRQRINRRKRAYAKKFVSMPRHERQAILEYIQKTLCDPTDK